CGLQRPRDRASLLGRLGNPLEVAVLDTGDRSHGAQMDAGDAGSGHERHFGAGAHRGGRGAVLVELIGQRHGEARRVCGSKQLLRVGGPGGGLGPGFPVDVEGGQTRRAQLGLTGTGTEIPAPGAGGGGGHWRRHAILRMVVGSVSTSILHVKAPTCTTAGARHPPPSPTPRRRIPFSPSYPTAFVPPPSCPSAVVPHRPYGERNVRDIMNRFTRPLSCVRQWGRWRKVAFGDGGAGQEVRRRSPPSVGRWLTRWRGAHPVAGERCCSRNASASSASCGLTP